MPIIDVFPAAVGGSIPVLDPDFVLLDEEEVKHRQYSYKLYRRGERVEMVEAVNGTGQLTTHHWTSALISGGDNNERDSLACRYEFKRNEQGEVVELSPVQQKFLEHFSFQCGYCAPGFVNAATVLIERLKREPIAKESVEREITKALDDHICRCTGYVRYYEAVKDVVLNTPGLVKDSA